MKKIVYLTFALFLLIMPTIILQAHIEDGVEVDIATESIEHHHEEMSYGHENDGMPHATEEEKDNTTLYIVLIGAGVLVGLGSVFIGRE